MKKAEEYRAHAEDCRRLASQTRDQNEKQQILKVAEVWEDLARTREKITKRAGSN
jgi:RNA polymerase-interacting CarD/CdnL/TRCF family regulator